MHASDYQRRPRGSRRALDARQRRPIVAARADRARAGRGSPTCPGLEGYVEDSGEGRWTLHEGIDRGVPLPVLTAALFTRFRSRENNPFSERLLAALRNQFGGHAVKKA